MYPSLSYSNWATLRQCGQKYKLQVQDKIPTPRVVALEFGTALHAGLNQTLEKPEADDAETLFKLFWTAKISELNFKGERHTAQDLEFMGARFVSMFAKRYAAKMKLIVAEKRMYAKWGTSDELSIEGTPDALVEYDGQNVLLDFKSSAYSYPEEKSLNSMQLNLYAWLLEKNGFKVDSLAYVVFVKGTGSIQTVKTIPYKETLALQMISEMVEYFKRNIGNTERNAASCIMGKSICPYFKSHCWKESD